MDELPQAFTELMSEGKTQQAVDLYQSVLDIFTSEDEQQVVFKESAGEVILETGNAQTAENAETAQTAETGGNAETAAQTGNVQQPVLPEAVESAEAQIQQLPAKDAGGENQTTGTVGTLTGEQWKALGDMMEDLGAEPDMAAQIRNGQISSGEILNLVKGFVQQSSLSGKISHELESLLDSREFGTMLKSEIEKQWLIEPQNVADPKKVEELYERIRNQSERLHETLEAAGKGDTPVAKSVQNLQNNVDFMNKINQVFTYIQLPLKMSGNNAHGDLYIYTNKKHLAAKDGNVSALLHLDMENLGPLDVYVAMQNNKVSTNFTLQDESALDLIEENIGILDERLAKRGYDLKAQFHMKEEQEEDSPEGIMQTILNQEKNISVLSRTSFDMRA
jgi:flagellar hook-length control protein FliK